MGDVPRIEQFPPRREHESPLEFMECESSGVNMKIIPVAELCNKAGKLLPHHLFHFHLLFELVSVSEISTGMICLKLTEKNVKENSIVWLSNDKSNIRLKPLRGKTIMVQSDC